MNSTQKKKLWYSFLGVVGIAMVVAISVILWGTTLADTIKAKIASSIVGYASIGFLIFKVVYFFVVEVIKKKVLDNEKKIREFIVEKPIEKIQEKVEDTMSKKTKTLEQITNFNCEKTIQKFTFSINENKGIFISFDKNDFSSREQFFKELKYATSEMLEQMRKEIDKDC